MSSDPEDDKTARKRIADDVWCRTCDTVHIAYIPVTTFRCADCGFGQWAEDLAESHASAFPSHVVYSLVHEVEPPMTADPVRPQETLRARLIAVLRTCTCREGHNQYGPWRRIDMSCALCGSSEGRADAVLPIVEEETARQADLIAEFRKRDESASRVIRNAIKQAAEHGTELAALRDKVK